jgi:hypothetical protein
VLWPAVTASRTIGWKALVRKARTIYNYVSVAMRRPDNLIGRHSAMSTQSTYPLRRYRYLLLAAVIIPFLPEIVIVVTAAVAELTGWDQKGLSTFASAPVTKTIDLALDVAASGILALVEAHLSWLVLYYLCVSLWLFFCLVLVSLGWSSTLARLLIGFSVATAFAFLPYFGPWLAIAGWLNEHCRPNEGHVGLCVMFGGYVWNAHDTISIGWLALYGIPLAWAIFGIYAAFITFLGIYGRRSRSPK